MARIYLPYFVSGFASLAYQICWYRFFVDRLGANNITFVLVLCSFIGGLAVGSASSRRAARWLQPVLGNRDSLTFYGQIELIITGTALGLFLFSSFPNYLVGSFPYVLRNGIYEPTLIYQIYKALAVVLCVFVPCFFMGVTFPLLCSVFSHLPNFPSRLYAWNTLGACLGILACEFVFIRYLGTTVAFCIALVMNVLLAAGFLRYGESIFERLVARQESSPAGRGETAAGGSGAGSGAEGRVAPPMAMGTAMACAVVSGVLSGGLEADIMKRLPLWGDSLKIAFSFVVFWAILAIFLASWSIRGYRPWLFLAIKLLYVGAFVYHLAVSAHHLALKGAIGAFACTHFGRDLYTVGLVQTFLSAGLTIFPTYFCLSLLLPYVCNRCQAAGRHLGRVYGVNTFAFCAGVLLFGWVAPLVNPFYSLRLFIGVFALSSALLFALSEARAPRRLILIPVGAALALLVALTPGTFDREIFGKKELRTVPISGVRSDGAHLIYVGQFPKHKVMYFDAHRMSSTSTRCLRYMKLMAHFPLLAHPNPRRALLICFGVGNTAKAIADHSSIERIDAVDLSSHVFELAPYFAETNNRVYEDRRIRLIHDDGRNFLNLTEDTYDLITSEPPPPAKPGVGRLYSREYYLACLHHLTPNGIVSQWLPVFQLTPAMVDRVVATFRSVFPQTLIFVGHGPEFIMLGSVEPIDLAGVEKRFAADKAVVEDMRSVGVESPAHLFARIVQVDDMVDYFFKGKPVISDETNSLEYAVTTLLQLMAVPGEEQGGERAGSSAGGSLTYYQPEPVLSELRKYGLRSCERLNVELKSRQGIKALVPDFPLWPETR